MSRKLLIKKEIIIIKDVSHTSENGRPTVQKNTTPKGEKQLTIIKI